MWDPQYAQQMLWQDDANNSITLGALIVGVANPYKLTDDEFAKVKAKLIEQKKLLLSYYAGFDDGVNLFAQNGIKLMYSMGEPQVPALEGEGRQCGAHHPEGARGRLARLLGTERRRQGQGSGPSPGSMPAWTKRSARC